MHASIGAILFMLECQLTYIFTYTIYLDEQNSALFFSKILLFE